jgi:hypothetical protein
VATRLSARRQVRETVLNLLDRRMGLSRQTVVFGVLAIVELLLMAPRLSARDRSRYMYSAQ